MIEASQNLLGFESSWQGMIDGGGQITAHHADEIETNTYAGPHAVHVAQAYHDDKCDAHCSGHHGAAGVGPGIPDFFFLGIFYCH